MPSVMESPGFTNDQVIEHFNAFFETTRKLLEVSSNKAKREERDGETQSLDNFDRLIIYIFVWLSLERISATLRDLFPSMDDDDKMAIQLLAMEMQFFNLRYGNVTVESSPYTVSHGLDDAKTITGSIKGLIDKLPKWMRKILEVLSEALGLAKNILPFI